MNKTAEIDRNETPVTEDAKAIYQGAAVEQQPPTQEETDQIQATIFKIANRIVCDAILPAKRSGADPVAAVVALLDTAQFLSAIIGGNPDEQENLIQLFESAHQRAKLRSMPMIVAYGIKNNVVLDSPNYAKDSVFNDQKIFMDASGQSVGSLNLEQATLYRKLVSEEFIELDEAFNHFDAHFAGMKDMPGYNAALGEVAKEACDVIVVTAGLLQSIGISPQDAWEEVMGSNLSKIDPDTGTVLKREDGKVLKGPNFRKADMERLVVNSQ